MWVPWSCQPFKLPVFLKLTNTDPFRKWFEVTGDATPDGIRVVWSVLGAISSLLILAGCKRKADALSQIMEDD